MSELADALRELHKPFAIYDECEHEHALDDNGNPVEPNVVDVDSVGLSCNKLYDVCQECCTDGFQDEVCITYHGHFLEHPICATRALVDSLEPLGREVAV